MIASIDSTPDTIRDLDDLRLGLKALRVLARHAPIDLARFAALNGLAASRAAELVEVFASSGFVRQRPADGPIEVTALAVEVLAGAEPGLRGLSRPKVLH